MSISDAKWTVAPDVLASLITSFYFWLSSSSTPKFSPMFPILCPLLPLLLEFSSPGASEWTYALNCDAILNSLLSLQCALHESSSSLIRFCLVDSCASALQLNLVFASDALAFSFFYTTVSQMLPWENALLHGIAAAIALFNFRLAFLMMSLYSSSLGSTE